MGLCPIPPARREAGRAGFTALRAYPLPGAAGSVLQPYACQVAVLARSPVRCAPRGCGLRSGT